ncbi:MAG: aminoacetone oxidase family FAD-binding enzyme, partial [Clostridia bacterium]|nr:aminoacetone oxidase family FAD-binding enzyme [Clostridia bacterium]
YSAFYQFNAKDTMTFFENLGVKLKTERGRRVFPESDKSSEIRDALVRFALDCGVEFLSDNIRAIKPQTDGVLLIGTTTEYLAKRCIIATGGLSYPKTGSTGDGYLFAKSLGHTIVEPRPSLIGLKCKQNFCCELAGMTLKNVSVSFYNRNKCVYRDFGELLFTHIGISGPTVLSASAHYDDFEQAKVVIDFKPALTEDQLDQRLLRDFSSVMNKNVINGIEGILPHKLLPILLEYCKISPLKKVNQITKTERELLVHSLKSFSLDLIGKEGIEKAIITAGGISVNEISPKTMASKICDKVYFAGEVLDVDAYTGGFNLQIAFSTGYLAGKSAAEELL